MEWLKRLSGKVVAVDTSPLIYFIEANATYLPTVQVFFEAADRGEFRLVTSAISLTEVLVHPFRSLDLALAGRYKDILLRSGRIVMYPVSVSVAELAAQLRAAHGLKTPDAIQIATGKEYGASFS